MAAARFKKSGGGFLNGVNGVLTGLRFNEKTWGEGDDAYRTLDAELEILQDGAEESVKQFLPAGFLYGDQTVDEDGDGSTIEGAEGEACVAGNSDFARFVQTAIEGGFPEDDFDEDDPNNFQALVGKRYTFAKELNKERQLAAGKKKLGKAKAAAATEEEIMQAGRRQDKNDKKKFYNHDRLIVSAYLGEAEEAPKGSKGKATASKSSGKADKGGSKSKAKKDGVTEEQADEMLLNLLASAKNSTINKAQLSAAMVRKAVEDDMEDDVRDEYREFFDNDEYLAREEGWTFDADAKGAPVALAKKGKK